MNAANLSAADLARATKKTPGAVTQWLDGTIKSLKAETANMMELATGYRAMWLVTGKGPKKVISAAVDPAPDARGDVPLIRWVKAGDWSVGEDSLQLGEVQGWLRCPRAHSPRTFALTVRGDSMTALHGNSRTYPAGSVIFVDPEKRTPEDGERVIAKLEGSDDVTFKVYKNEDGRKWLQPLNPSHEPFRDEFRIIGTVIGKWEDE